jgi:cell wall assembly regulator SMI1
LILADGASAKDGEIRASWREFDAWMATEPGAPTTHCEDQDNTGMVKPSRWRRGWIKVATSSDSDSYMVDVDPANAANLGQVLYWCHESPGIECVHTTSFVDWLEWSAKSDAFHDSYDD